MGTRGFVGFVVDGTEKITYNHFDSYPEGLGVDVLAFLTANVADADKIAEDARRLRPVDENSKPTKAERLRFAKFTDSGVSGGDDWYAILRRTQGDLAAILEAGVYGDAKDFPLDSLFAEWGYLVNLDDRKLEVYRGFQDAPHDKGRYAKRQTAGLAEGQPRQILDNTYYPCALVKTYDFDALPKGAQFVADLTRVNVDPSA
jgi:hypothetical protein